MDKRLSDYTPSELRAALALAEEREKKQEEEEALARWPKCRCGKPATTICEPRVEYVYRSLRADAFGRAYRCSMEETTDTAPGDGEVDSHSLAWGACDDCQGEAWAAIDNTNVGW